MQWTLFLVYPGDGIGNLHASSLEKMEIIFFAESSHMALQRNRYHGKRQYLFIESICNDPDILAQNYRYKMMYSPDYKTTTEEEVRPSHLLRPWSAARLK